MKIYALILSLLFSVCLRAQKTSIKVVDLKPISYENVFPFIESTAHPKVAEKINIVLHWKYLDLLPQQYKNNPFEKVSKSITYAPGNTNFGGYDVIATPKQVLSLRIQGSSTGTYTHEFENYLAFDLRTGNQLFMETLFTSDGIGLFEQQLNQQVETIITHHLQSIKKLLDNETNEDELEYLDDLYGVYSECLENVDRSTIDFYDFVMKKDSITFIREQCANHALRAIDDLGKFKISYAYSDLEKQMTPFGNGLVEGEDEVIEVNQVKGKFYKGMMGKNIPITLYFWDVYAGNNVALFYWYDQYQKPIEWLGTFDGKQLKATERTYYQGTETVSRWINVADVSATLEGDTFTGRWEALNSGKVYDFTVKAY